jgi:hypothetical protein
MEDGDYLEGPGLYGRITLKWIFRLIEIIHMTLGQESRKNLPLKSQMGYSLSSIQGVPGGKDLTLGVCSLGQTIPL